MQKLSGVYLSTFYNRIKIQQYNNDYPKTSRSRDQAILDTCDVVVDVGGSYDPSKHRYDHHMRTFKETAKSVIKKPGFDWEIKLSSAGLVFCHFGFEIIKQIIPELQNEDDVELVFKMVYDGLIREIDAIDNGVTMFDGEPRYC